MKLDEQCRRRAAGGGAAAADVSGHDPGAETACVRVAQDGLGRSLGGATSCRAGFAGRGTAFTSATGRHTLASAFDPRRSLGSRS